MKTLVIGASTNPERYSYKAITALVYHGHEVVAHGLKTGDVAGIQIDTEKKIIEGVDTITLYVGPQNQSSFHEYIKALKPRRVLFNPGTENPALEQELAAQGIETVEACTLVLLSTGQY